MTGRVDGGDAEHDFISGRDESRALRQAGAYPPEQVTVGQPGRANRVAFGPEGEFGRAEYVAGAFENRFTIPDQTANVVRVTVRDDHDIDVVRAEPKVAKAIHNRTVLVSAARVEQDLLRTGIDQRWNETMLVPVSVDEVRERELVDRRLRLSDGESRCKIVPDIGGVEQSGGFEGAETEGEDAGAGRADFRHCRLYFALAGWNSRRS
jgi:hypothetical protein